MMTHDDALRRSDDADDLQAINETLQGSSDAFGRIVDRYTPVIYSLAIRYLSDAEDAEDATQEVLTKAFESLRRFSLGKRFYPWLYTIAVNHLKFVRGRAARRFSKYALSYEDRVSNDEIDQPLHDPVRDLDRKEGEALVRRALDRLPSKYRDILILRQFEELSVAEVAEILDMPEGTVKTNLHRARKALAAVIAGAE